jgi:hypothetical protein
MGGAGGQLGHYGRQEMLWHLEGETFCSRFFSDLV